MLVSLYLFFGQTVFFFGSHELSGSEIRIKILVPSATRVLLSSSAIYRIIILIVWRVCEQGSKDKCHLSEYIRIKLVAYLALYSRSDFT